jgi:predicted ATPase
MLTAFKLKNFKSFQAEAVLPLEGALTVLIGANAAGKSNALEALRLLSWLAQGNKLGAIQHEVNRADKVVRGRVPDLFREGETRFSLGCQVTTPTDPTGQPDPSTRTSTSNLSMTLELRADDLHIVAECIDMGMGVGVPLYDMDQPSQGDKGTEAGVAYNNFSKGGNKPHIKVTDQMAVFAQLDSPASFHANHRKAQHDIPRVCKAYQALLSNVLFLDPVPAKMRDFSFLADKRLGGDGANLSSVLHGLWTAGAASDVPAGHPLRHELVSFIQSLPEQDIVGLDFLEGPRGDVMVQLIETFSGSPRKFEAALLSDGTLRVLAIAAAMLSAPEGSLVVIEEIDNGVHPSRARHLLERIQSVAERRSLRVLLSTHNPAMLDALPDKAVPDVVFCYRDPQAGDSRLVRLGSLPDAPELFIQDSLGHLMTSGAIDRFVKNHPGPEARKQKAKAWLAALRASATGVNE